uniref:Palmdelphin n=1 Tax=Bubo bubo TaxID=30461 RepID=A0A8C0ESX0_BUBBB
TVQKELHNLTFKVHLLVCIFPHQKKALREKWLLDGLSSLTPKEQEEMQKQNQEDQQRTHELEQDIFRLEKEIEALEKEEMEVSAKEEAILKKLKSVEKTTEDIIKHLFLSTALFAMEIKVEKDMKTGENTVLSTIPLPSKEFKETGIKVYDDGRKSVYAVSSNGSTTQNGMDELAPVEVEDLLRQATEKNSQSPTEYHEPVFKDKSVPCPKLEDTHKKEMNGFNVQYSIVQAIPCYVDDSEPVTMIFMGYQRIDDDDAEADQKLSRYDGVIRAELVIIDDDDDDSKSEKPAYHPIGHYSQVYQPPSRKITEVSQMNPVSSLGVSLNKVPHKNSISLQEQEERLSSPTHRAHLHSQVSGDGTEDPSLTGNRKGKSCHCCSLM